MNRVRRFFHSVSEMIIPDWGWPSFSGVRSTFRSMGIRWWPRTHPAGEGTIVNYDLCRQLYRNSGENALGAGFAKPIVNLQVGFIGMPSASTNDPALDQYLNECLETYWTDEIQQLFRDSLRDSKTIIRLQPIDILDPLMTMEERDHFAIEVIPPERVDIEYNARNRHIVERCAIRHRMVFVTDKGDVSAGTDPITEEHDVIEIITKESYSFFDQMTSEYIDSMGAPNSWGFVPVLEVYNEWDAALQGGQSEFENVIPFINAFHDVLAQGLQAHRYHSTPKLKLKLTEVGAFIKNNFPDAWDQTTGDVRPNTEVSLNGREIIFLGGEDEAGFIEARSVLGDTKSLLEFLIDCICIASETPEWAFMRVDSGSANSDRNAQTVPLVKKVDRKRRMFTKYIQQLLKMAIVASGKNDGIPIRAKINWQVVRSDDQFVTNQAFQQLLMGLEVARARGEITDEDYQQAIKPYLPHMLADGRMSEPDAPALPPGSNPNPVVAGPQGANE